MLSEELRKLKRELEVGKEQIDINRDKLLKELQDLEDVKGMLYHSLSLSGNICPTCGRLLK